MGSEIMFQNHTKFCGSKAFSMRYDMHVQTHARSLTLTPKHAFDRTDRDPQSATLTSRVLPLSRKR